MSRDSTCQGQTQPCPAIVCCPAAAQQADSCMVPFGSQSTLLQQELAGSPLIATIDDDVPAFQVLQQVLDGGIHGLAGLHQQDDPPAQHALQAGTTAVDGGDGDHNASALRQLTGSALHKISLLAIVTRPARCTQPMQRMGMQAPAPHLGFCREDTKSLRSSKPCSFSPRPAPSGLFCSLQAGLDCSSQCSRLSGWSTLHGCIIACCLQLSSTAGREALTLFLRTGHSLCCLLIGPVEDADREPLTSHVEGQVLHTQ